MFPEHFSSERLFARLPQPSDAALLFAAYTSKPEVSRYMIWRPHGTVAETEQFISGCIAAVDQGTRFPYVITEASNRTQPIGMLEARPLKHQVDLGYVLAPEFWGHGYMPEAVCALTDLLLTVDEIFRVQIFCDVDNLPSQRVAEKSGFVREGRLERFCVHPNISDEPRPCYMYSRCR